LFQTLPSTESQLQNILTQELEYFSSVLQFSQKIQKQIKSLPVSVLAEMVNYRQTWVEKIQNLEEQRKKLESAQEDPRCKEIIKNISKSAEKLVKIDERIYAGLQQRKLKFVREHSDVVSEAKYLKDQKSKRGHSSSKLVDIVQE
jgi:hypothetical protein